MAARKKKDEELVNQVPDPIAGTEPTATATMESPSDPNGQNGTVETPSNKPAYFVSVPVGRDTYVQASVWPKTVELRDGGSFTTHEVTVRKRYKDANGDFQSAHKFRGSECYALQHVIRRAEEFILNLRTTDDIPF